MAKPPANATVGKNDDLSLRSPAAVDMYDKVKGNNPKLQGEKDVKSPAKYNKLRLAGFIKSFSLLNIDEANEDAED